MTSLKDSNKALPVRTNNLTGRTRNGQVNKSSTNERAIEQACKELRDELAFRLQVNPDAHGSITATIQLTDGIIDRFSVTAAKSTKTELLTA